MSRLRIGGSFRLREKGGSIVKKRIFAVLAALVLLFTACSSAPEVEYGPDVENPYPEVKGPALGCPMLITPQEMLKDGGSYVEGVIKTINPPTTEETKAEWFDVLLEKNPDAKLPDTTYYSFDFEVKRVLAGEKVPNEITVYTIFQSAFPPEMKEGDRFVVGIEASETEHTCSLLNVFDSFYYISEENRIYPGCRFGYSLECTGMTVDMFKDALNKKE